MKQAVVYTWVSTEEHLLGDSPTTQLRTCTSYAENYGYEIVKVFRDQGGDSTVINRAELRNMFSYCEEHKGEIEGVIVSSVDRFNRNANDYIALRNDLKCLGVRLLVVSQEQDTVVQRFFAALVEVFKEYDEDLRAAQKREREYEASGRLH